MRLVLAPHGTRTRYEGSRRVPGCRCDPCTDANRARPRGGWPFEAYAVSPAVPAIHKTTAKSVVCCEREALEIEGAGHDPYCPQRGAA